MAMTICTCATYLAPVDERFSFEPRSVQAIYIVSALFVVTGYQRPEQPGNILQQRANADFRRIGPFQQRRQCLKFRNV